MILFLKAVAGSFLGTLGFAMLQNAPKKSWLCSSLLGMLCYGIYEALLYFGVNDVFAMFAGALAASLLAQIAASRIKMISTIFVLLSIVSGVPGLSLYNCMSLLAEGNTAEGISVGVGAMASILMIVIAQGISSYAAHVIHMAEQKKKGEIQ